MHKTQTGISVRRIAWLFCATYLISYLTRINFSTIISEIELSTGFPREQLSMSLTGLFVCYGIGQVISGKCGDRFSPKKMISVGLSVSTLVNLIIPICTNPWQMLAVWCVNGFAQSFMWPPMVRLMVALLTQEEYISVNVKVAWGSSFGTVIMYLIAPALITLLGWRSVFLFSACCGMIGIVLWQKLAYDIPPEPAVVKTEHASGKKARIFSPVMLAIMAAIILHGMLRDGVTTWVPTLITETYQISNVISILTGVVLPLFSILCYQVASILYKKYFTNPVLCSAVIFGTGAAAALVLYLCNGLSPIVSALLAALLTGCMHGVNWVLIGMIPAFFRKTGSISTVSGALNACTYIGSALSTYGVAVLSQQVGWQGTILIWLLIAAGGAVICALNTKPWNQFQSKLL